MLITTPRDRTFTRSRKLEAARRHARVEPPIIERIAAIVAPFESSPETIVVARDTDLLMEYKSSIGQENFERLVISID